MNQENPMKFDRLARKVAVITGAASGIGEATARLFAREGASVTVVDIQSEGKRVVEEIRKAGGQALFIEGDVSDADTCRRIIDETVKTFHGLDIVFNNAGIIRRADVVELSEADWDHVMAVNVKSVFLLSKVAIPVMIERGGGSIINTSSGWGLVGGAKAISYCASKGAVVQMTRAMAIDHGASNIRVNCICPGDVDTPMLTNEAKQLGESVQVFLQDAADRPLQRIGKPDEIARAVLFLAGDDSSFVTGATLVVDGGGLA